MNITNAEYFTFNAHNSLLLVGQSGSGKSYLVHKLVSSLGSSLDPDTKFVIFDLKHVEFIDKKSAKNFEVITDPEPGLKRLDELSELATSRDGSKNPLLFMYIEECDMAVIDQKRFDKSLINIIKNARKANIKVIYSTSRPAPDCISSALLNNFELILAGRLSAADQSYLGVKVPDNLVRYAFVESKNSGL